MSLSIELEQLPIQKKLELVEELWDSIEHDKIEPSTSILDEIKRRLNRYKSGDTSFFTWDEIKRDLKNFK